MTPYLESIHKSMLILKHSHSNGRSIKLVANVERPYANMVVPLRNDGQTSAKLFCPQNLIL